MSGAVIRKGAVRRVERFAVPAISGPAEAPRVEDRVEIIFPTAGELEGIRANAFEQGFSAGKAEGLMRQGQVIDQMGALVQAIEGKCLELQQSYLDAVGGVMDEVLAAIGDGAPASLLAKVRHALGALCPPGEIKVLVNPQDLQAIGEMTGLEVGRARAVFVASEEVRAGGFLMRHSAGELDCTVEAAVAAIRKALADGRGA